MDTRDLSLCLSVRLSVCPDWLVVVVVVVEVAVAGDIFLPLRASMVHHPSSSNPSTTYIYF